MPFTAIQSGTASQQPLHTPSRKLTHAASGPSLAYVYIAPGMHNHPVFPQSWAPAHIPYALVSHLAAIEAHTRSQLGGWCLDALPAHLPTARPLLLWPLRLAVP